MLSSIQDMFFWGGKRQADLLRASADGYKNTGKRLEVRGTREDAEDFYKGYM